MDKISYKFWKLKLRLMRLPQSDAYHITVLIVEVAYFCVLCTTHWQQPGWLTTVQDSIGGVLLMLMLLDCMFQLWSSGWKNYISSGLNQFKLVTLVLDSLTFLLSMIGVLGGYPYGLLRLSWLPIFCAKAWKYYVWKTPQHRLESLYDIPAFFAFQVPVLWRP